MKMNVRLLGLIVLTSLLFVACNREDKGRENDIVTIDLDALVKNTKTMGLADIAKDIRYIPLETIPEAMLNPSKLLYVNNRIFVLNRNGEVFLFDDDGKFIRQIGAIGKGPDEYIGAQYMEVSVNGTLINIYNQRFGNGGYTYDLDGNQIKSFKMKYTAWKYAPLSEDRHIMISPYGSFSPDSAKFLFYLQDGSGNVIRKYPSTQVIKMMGDFSIGAFFINPLSVLAYQPFCDTVFRVDGEGNMDPEYLLNFGDHHAPDELYADMANVMNPTEPYYLTPYLHQTKNQLFIRIRQKSKNHIGIYNSENEDIYSFISNKGKIPNDLDGGPDFWPSGTDGNQMVYRMIQPVDLLNPDEEKQKDKLEVKDKDKAAVYQEMINSLDENDNPIVMVVELKKH